MDSVAWSALGAVVLVAAVTSVWLARARRDAAGQPLRSANITAKVRLRALNLTPEETGIAVPHTGVGVWGAVAELGSPHGAATAVALADGSATLHEGGGTPMVAEHGPEEIKRAALATVAAADACSPHLRARGIHKLPRPGHVRLYALSRTGLLSSEEIPTADLMRRDDPVARWLQEIDRLVAALRSTGTAA